MTSEDYQKLLDLGGENADSETQMLLQQAQAKRLRAGNDLQMRNVRGIPVAPSWAEALGSIGREGFAGSADSKAGGFQQQKNSTSAAQNAMILKALLENSPQAAQPSSAGMSPQGSYGMQPPKGVFGFGG